MVIVAVLTYLSLHVFAEEPTADRRKAETITKADKLFGERYAPVAGKSMQLFDEENETGPPDSVIYRHGSSYVLELIFAADGTVAGLILLPEPLLHSDNWSDVSNWVELPRAEMQRLVASANELQPLGKAREIMEAPDRCFQSGPNLYCADSYELDLLPRN